MKENNEKDYLENSAIKNDSSVLHDIPFLSLTNLVVGIRGFWVGRMLQVCCIMLQMFYKYAEQYFKHIAQVQTCCTMLQTHCTMFQTRCMMLQTRKVVNAFLDSRPCSALIKFHLV